MKQRLDGPERCVLRRCLRDDNLGGTKPVDQAPEFVLVGDRPANICEVVGGTRMQIDPPALRVHAQRYGAIRSRRADAKPQDLACQRPPPCQPADLEAQMAECNYPRHWRQLPANLRATAIVSAIAAPWPNMGRPL